MKALQVVAPRQAEFVDAPRPELKPGHALVRTRYLALCGSDIWMLDHNPPERYPFPVGTTGHEVIGEIVALEGEHRDVGVGDLTLTLAPDHRGMSEYYLAEVDNLLPLPKGKTPEELLMAQQLGTVIFAARQLPSVIGKTVAVVGQGSAGLWFNVMLKRFGAGRVIALDNHQHRMTLSERYGADAVICGADRHAVDQFRDANEGQLADIVIEAAGREAAINLSFRLAKQNTAFMLQFGLPRPPLQVNYDEMFWKCLTVKSIVHAASEAGHTSTRHALELIGSGALDVKPVLTHRFPFSQVLEAFELQRTAADGAVKTIV